MSNIKILDCTLRDGGYCNEWQFGNENIKKIISGLKESQIDIIECGFLTKKVNYNLDISKFNSVNEVAKVIPSDRENRTYVCMVNYGEYDADELPIYDGTSIDGIRVAFHKKDIYSALELCRKIKDKGYKVFVQPMVSLNYTDEEFINLIHQVNEFDPYAFYIVDSFGVMKRKDLKRLFYLVEHNLKKKIHIGYHSHNNMQLAYSNAQTLVDVRTERSIIIDSSIFGMGRGAGNLNTELFVEYLNDNIGIHYELKPLLAIIDEILNDFYHKNYWGYSLPNYLSAKHNVHPNYASYLDEKKTLTVENMDDIFSMIERDNGVNYDRNYIEELYTKYLATGNIQENNLNKLKELIKGSDILIIAPGKSSISEKEKILDAAKKDCTITFSINFDYPIFDTDFIFLSNLRRYRELPLEKRNKCIVTSNIPAIDCYIQTKYSLLLNQFENVRDNSGMMLIKYLIELGAKKILLAGFDGYSIDPTQNFAEQRMNFFVQKASFEAMNEGMNKALAEFKNKIDLEFITTPKFVRI